MTTQLSEERDLRQEWETPQGFFDVADREFNFILDAAATCDNAKCAEFISPERDALRLSVRWVPNVPDYALGNVWLNPGFSDVAPWMAKAHREADAFAISVVVMALISPSTKWWRDWAMKASEIRLLGGKRIQFVAPEGVKQSSNARENCLIIFRPNPHNLEPRIWTWDWNAEHDGETSALA